MKKHETEFEVIDQYGERHRFKRGEGYWWAWRPKPGTADVPDTEFLDVFKHFEEDEDEDGEGTELFATFPKPARVGNVSEDACLSMPFRELQMERCPRCGFIVRPNETWAKKDQTTGVKLVARVAELEFAGGGQKPAGGSAPAPRPDAAQSSSAFDESDISF